MGLGIMGVFGTAAGLVAGTVVFAGGTFLLYPLVLALALSGVPDDERASVIGVTTAFFDLSVGGGSVLLGAVAELGGYRAMYLAGGAFALLGLVLLRSGFDPRVRSTSPTR